MSVTQASDTENMQVKINSNDKQSKNGDEEIEGMSVSDAPDFQDPAILVLSEIVKIRYTKEELIKLRDVPLSKRKPEFLDSSEVSPSILDPERWNFEGKKQQSASADGNASNSRGTAPTDEHRRRSGADPRERVRKEGDGIILSPQRRSFISGCFVPARSGAGDGGRGVASSGQSSSGRSHSPLGGGKGDGHVGIREIQPTGSRRIGSGRILRDNWDFNDKPDMSSDDYGGSFRNQRGDRDEKYERRSFGRDFEMTRDRGEQSNKDRRNNGRFERRRISENRDIEEPEWFSGGPVSQNDTIELRGFEDNERPGKKKLSPSRVKRAKEWSKKKNNPDVPEETKDETKAEATLTTSTLPARVENDKQKTEIEEKKLEDKAPDGSSSQGSVLMNEQSFNFDDILKCDTIPGLLTNGVEDEGDNQAKSRFSRWFKKPDSPVEKHQQQGSRRSSIHEDHHLNIKDLLNDISETSVTIPGDADAYFAPISPAGKTNPGFTAGRHATQQQAIREQQQGMSIMEMLQRGKTHQQQVEQTINAIKQPTQMAGKILSLDELEAKMRHNAETATGIPQKHQQQKPDEEMTTAFKKLLAQAQIGGVHSINSNGPVNKSQPMSLLEMLNHSQQQDEAARLSAAAANPHLLVGPASPNINHHHPHHPVHHVNDLQLKLQQAQYQQHQKQMEMLNKLINSTTVGSSATSGQMGSSPSLHDVCAQSRDLLSRPEAQAILQGLKRGEITVQHLYTQLANPALQPRHREMLATILKVQGATVGGYGGPSPRVLSPVPPSSSAAHHMYQQQQQQLRVSPLPPNAMHQRIPSPRELQVHTQNILQRALIKKKLEEQQENYRKKQEMQRGSSPASGSSGTAKSVSSPTPLAFTPTSVLRKMTADKDEGKENKLIGDLKIPPGRPLTGMRPQPQQPQGQQWGNQYPTVKQPVGRPIVKANNNYQSPEQFFNQQQRLFMQAAAAAQTQPLQSQAQQQQRKPVTSTQYGTGQVSSSTGAIPPSQYSSYPSNTNQQFTQQQLRAQHQHRPVNQQQGQQPQQMGYQTQQAGQQQAVGTATWQQFFNSAQASRPTNTMGRPNDLSPTTSDQLARWFSPDLLERARGGELPSTAGLGQNALSLEEIERQTAPPVHN